ncbi:MAG: S1 family peptidase, partial [Nocardioidaceae bacterium]
LPHPPAASLPRRLTVLLSVRVDDRPVRRRMRRRRRLVGRTTAVEQSLRSADQAQRISRSVDSAAGSYIDSSGRVVVNVTDRADVAKVEGSGAEAAVVRYSTRQLDKATAKLGRQTSIPGTAWAVDPTTNSVTVSADSTVSKNQLGKIKAVTRSLGDKATLSRTAGAYSTRTRGGDAIYAQAAPAAHSASTSAAGRATTS